MKNYVRAMIGAGLLALGVAGTIPSLSFTRQHQHKIDAYCTSEVRSAIDLRNKQYIELRSLKDCILDIHRNQSVDVIKEEYGGCMDNNLESLVGIARKYKTHLVDTSVSHEQIADCDSVMPVWNYPGHEFWSFVGAGSISSAILGLLGLGIAYRRRKEEE